MWNTIVNRHAIYLGYNLLWILFILKKKDRVHYLEQDSTKRKRDWIIRTDIINIFNIPWLSHDSLHATSLANPSALIILRFAVFSRAVCWYASIVSLNGNKYAWLKRKPESESRPSEVINCYPGFLTLSFAEHVLPGVWNWAGLGFLQPLISFCTEGLGAVGREEGGGAGAKRPRGVVDARRGCCPRAAGSSEPGKTQARHPSPLPSHPLHPHTIAQPPTLTTGLGAVFLHPLRLYRCQGADCDTAFWADCRHCPGASHAETAADWLRAGRVPAENVSF